MKKDISYEEDESIEDEDLDIDKDETGLDDSDDSW